MAVSLSLEESSLKPVSCVLSLFCMILFFSSSMNTWSPWYRHSLRKVLCTFTGKFIFQDISKKLNSQFGCFSSTLQNCAEELQAQESEACFIKVTVIVRIQSTVIKFCNLHTPHFANLLVTLSGCIPFIFPGVFVDTYKELNWVPGASFV